MKLTRGIRMYPFFVIALVLIIIPGFKSKDSAKQPGNTSISVNAVPLPSWNDTDHKKAIFESI